MAHCRSACVYARLLHCQYIKIRRVRGRICVTVPDADVDMKLLAVASEDMSSFAAHSDD